MPENLLKMNELTAATAAAILSRDALSGYHSDGHRESTEMLDDDDDLMEVSAEVSGVVVLRPLFDSSLIKVNGPRVYRYHHYFCFRRPIFIPG
jgi:hypothetical protein